MQHRFIYILVLLSMVLGGCAMAGETELRWEWPAERDIQKKLIVEVTEVTSKSGLFGLKKSPSLAQGFPEPVVLKGVVKNGQYETVKLVLPKFELGDAKSGDLLAVGLVEDLVCICVSPVPINSDPDQWLQSWNCTDE
ncbi:hypothetical protein [Endozoicomonas numazuensis]|uniref:Lipoprotein n=1 Tax=Endozoicomonas numazuensis TaxID=1137799 RepID=A0A081NKM4_9GAMM|nr:hypothetical protein [Endozoicomonas numazuensis]KEQ18997.1 hypothetical protein GZ78_02850 [Endozoicomonas numazuensis]